MFDWVVWVIILTLATLSLIGLLKMAMEYPGLLKWKCIYNDSHKDKLEIDLSEYELAAIEIPDRRRSGHGAVPSSSNTLKVPTIQHHHVRIVEPEPCKFKEYIDEGVQTDQSDVVSDIHPASVFTVSDGTSVVSEVRSEVSARSIDPKEEKLFQDKIIVIDEVRQC